MGGAPMNYDVEGMASELETDLETLVGLYASYFEEMKTEITSMQEYLEKSDWYMLERVVHNIKGVSANLNISDVFSEAEKFDILLKKNISENAHIYIETIAGLIQEAEKVIRAFFFGKGINL